MWNDLCIGALGAIVMVDTRRLGDSFGAIDFFEHRGIPYVVAVNLFESAPVYPLHAVRTALSIAEDIPVVQCDARIRASARDVLITLVEYLIARRRTVIPPEPSRNNRPSTHTTV
jgi:signal recognition particle receptor subunit beta